MNVRKLNGWKTCLLSAFLSLVIMTTSTVAALAADNVAATMRLTKTQGTVQVSSSSGKNISLIKNMRLYNGYQLETEEKSYAWINLDSTKLVKLDAVSEASIRKSGKKLEILLDSGNLYFDVSKPLQDDESLNIRTSTMAVGIRGTSGWLEVLDKQTVLVCVLEGTVEVTVTDPVSGQSKTDAISAGESAIGVVYDPQEQLELGEKCDILLQTYTETDTSGFVLEELAQNKPLVEDIYQESDLDYRDLTPEEAGERLQADQEEVHQKLEELDRAQSSQNQEVSVDQVGKPKPVDPGNSGGSSGDSSGGSSGEGNPPEVSNRLPATATVPEILAALDRFDTVYVGDGVTSIRPFDAALPVTAGKTLQLDGPAEVTASGSLTVDGTVHAAADLANNGTITVNSRNTLYVVGSLRNQGSLTVTATGRTVVEGTISGNVYLIKGAELRFKQHDQLTLPRNWPVPALPDVDGYYAPTFHDIYTVTFNTKGGSTIDEMQLLENSVIPRPMDPTRTGYTFDGWFSDPRTTIPYNFDTPVTRNVTLYAKWIPLTYTVAFNTQGGSPVESATVEYNDAVTEPTEEPTRPGYLFDGWYQDAECTVLYDFDTAITGDITLYAKWVTAYTVTFITSGDQVDPVTVKSGSQLSKPDATHPNYTLVTWYTDSTYSEEYNFSASVTGNLTLYAQWWQGQENNALLWQVEDGGKTLILGESYTAKVPDAITDRTVLTEVVFRGSRITKLDTNAFSGCTSLEKIELPESLQYLGFYSFSKCSSLASIRIPDNVTQIYSYAFEDCTKLTTITLPDGLATIGQGAFSGCSSLAGIELPSGLEAISMEAFGDCTSLSSIQLPNGVKKIGDYAFNGCNGLVNVELSDSLTELGPGAFKGCSSLASITLPATLTKIGYYAFMECSGLTQITYEGNSIDWNAITIENLAVPAGTKIICSDGVTLVAQADGTFLEEPIP